MKTRLALLILCAVASAAPVAEHPFETAWREWATLANARGMNPGTIDAREPMAWAKVKSQFRRLEKDMDAFYRGER